LCLTVCWRDRKIIFVTNGLRNTLIYMDRKIEKSSWNFKSAVFAAGGAVLVLYLVWMYGFRESGSQSMRIDTGNLTISAVERAPFREFITVNAAAVPLRSIILDAVEGGRVERVMAESGRNVVAGDTLLVLSNNNLQLDVMNRETQILEQMNNLRNTRIALQQQRLDLRSDLLTHETELQQRRRDYQRDSTLFSRGLVAPHQFESSLQQFEQVRLRRDLFAEQLALDSAATESELRFIAESLVNMQRNLDLVSDILDNLVITAPISGQLTALDAEIGETKSVGQRLGQIDVLEGYRMRAQIDEIYITRVEAGQTAEFDLEGQTWTMAVTRIFPEVIDGRFQVELDFTGAAPASLRRGQTIRLRLAFSDLADAVLIPRGGFFQQTGGQWVFVLNSEGTAAERRDIRIGRQNARFYAIEEGLEPGERVITSSYQDFGDNTRLILE